MKCITLLFFNILITHAIVAQSFERQPVEAIRLVADKIIKSTPFVYELDMVTSSQAFHGLKKVDFGRSLHAPDGGLGYAIGNIESPIEQVVTVELEHTDELAVLVNGKVVYEKKGERTAKIERHERHLGFSFSTSFKLNKGSNALLLKSKSNDSDWIVYLQPEKISDAENSPVFDLSKLPNVKQSVADVTDWLVVGPFDGELEAEYAPDDTFETGKMYAGLHKPVTWELPKIDVTGETIDIDKTWGSFYKYNYHTGGVAWAMMYLSEVTGEERFDNYAKKYTDFMIESQDFISYQVWELGQHACDNQFLEHVPLLDFTLAPSLPFIQRLINDDNFENRAAYEKWAKTMIDYAVNRQVRLNGENYTRETPMVHTTWVDDMYMGLPFLAVTSQYVNDPELKEQLIDDAASQIPAFNEQVLNEDDYLYQHAQFSKNKVKMPYWSRANGWGIWATTEVLKALPANHKLYKPILKHYQRHVAALVEYQDAETGFWHNVLDVPESRLETSGTAIFTMAIARGINEGWLNKKYRSNALKGWEALDSVIENDGTVHNICMGTMCSEDLDYYLNRPFFDDDSHGLLALIFAAVEVQQMME